MHATSNDPQTTVDAHTFVQNLIVIGSIPPVVPADAITEARKVHGDAYTDEMVEALTGWGFVVEGLDTATPTR